MSARVPVLALLVVVGLLVFRVLSTPEPPSAPPRLQPTYAPFEVTTASGALSWSDLRGRAVVLYFGYTTCPDICPTTLAAVGAAIRKLSSEDAGRAMALMVSVDPERDAVDRIDDYVRYFHPRFRAGHVKGRDLAAVAADWGVFYRKEKGSTAMAYTMDHSTQAFLLNPKGEMVRQLPHGMSAGEIAAALKATLSDPKHQTTR